MAMAMAMAMPMAMTITMAMPIAMAMQMARAGRAGPAGGPTGLARLAAARSLASQQRLSWLFARNTKRHVHGTRTCSQIENFDVM